MMGKTIFSIVINDNQDYWNYRTDYLGSATTLKGAMQMVKKWVVKNEYLQAGEKFNDELNSSIEIWKQEINKYPNSERKIIPVDLNRLLAE